MPLKETRKEAAMKKDDLFTKIAQEHFNIETLEERKSDSLDFYNVAVWSVKDALEAAFAAGKLASTKKHQKRMSEGGGYLATIEISYTDLVAAFGTPSEGDKYKTEAEWTIRFPKGQKIAIYNYKNSKCYSSTMPDIENVTEWHIGGNNGALVDNIIRMLAGSAKLIHKTGE